MKQLIIMTILIAWSCSSPQAVKAQEAASLKDLCSFYLDFDETVTASVSKGKGAPSQVQFYQNGEMKLIREGDLGEYYVPGVVGKALSTKDRKTELWLLYEMEENFNYPKGTILFWMSYPDLTDDDKGGNMVFNHPNFGYLTLFYNDPRGIFFWFAPTTAQREKDGYNGQLHTWRPEPWKKGEWHQVAVTWKKDQAVYYEDGAALGKTTLKVPITAPENLYSMFSVVLAGWSGKTEHRIVAMDEFYVFPIVLNDQIIQQNYQQIKGAKK